MVDKGIRAKVAGLAGKDVGKRWQGIDICELFEAFDGDCVRRWHDTTG